MICCTHNKFINFVLYNNKTINYNNTYNTVNFSSYNNQTKHDMYYMKHPSVVSISVKYLVHISITYDALTRDSDPYCDDYFNITKSYGSDEKDGIINPFK